MVRLANEFWKIIKTKSTSERFTREDKKYSSLVTELQDHLAVYGNLKNVPPICWAVGLDGEYVMSKFLAAKEKWISSVHLKELDAAMAAENGDVHKEIKAHVTKVKLSTKEDSNIFKANGMTMDYGCFFWFTLKRAGLTAEEMALVLLSTNEMCVTCDSDNKCYKWLKMKAEGGGKQKVSEGKNKPVEAFKKVLELLELCKNDKREKLLKDNPWALTDKTLIESFKIAGIFPIVYRASRIIGRHDLFIVKNILCDSYSANTIGMIKDHFASNKNTEGHVIHRGLVGSIFANIHLMDTTKLTFSGKSA